MQGLNPPLPWPFQSLQRKARAQRHHESWGRTGRSNRFCTLEASKGKEEDNHPTDLWWVPGTPVRHPMPGGGSWAGHQQLEGFGSTSPGDESLLCRTHHCSPSGDQHPKRWARGFLQCHKQFVQINYLDVAFFKSSFRNVDLSNRQMNLWEKRRQQEN